MDDVQEQGPWTQYAAPPPAAPSEEEGPWAKYAQPASAQKPPAAKQEPTGALEHVKQSAKSMIPEMPHSLSDVYDYATGEKAVGGVVAALKNAPAEYRRARATPQGQNTQDAMPLAPAETQKLIDERRKGGFRNPVPGQLYAGAAAAAPLVPGMSAERQEHAAALGDTAGVLGENAIPATTALMPLAHEPLGRAVEAGRARLNTALEPGRLRAAPRNIETALATPAGKGGSRAAQMKSDIHVATADLAEIEKEAPAKVMAILKRGKGAENFHELAEKIDTHQEKMWEEGHKPGITRHAEAPIDHNAVANAGRSVLTAEATDAAPQEAAAAQSWLEGIAKERGLKSADSLVREINDDLKGKGADTRYGPLQVRVRQAVVKALRNEVERVLTDSGEKGVKAVNRRWGALENIKSRLQERAVQEAQREAKQGPVPDWVHLYSFMHPDMGLSVGAGVAAGKLLRPNPATQLTKGMRQLGRTSLEAPYNSPPPIGWDRPVHGLLPAPPAILENRAEPSVPGRGAVEAPSYVDRGAAGRMQRVYKGEMPPAVIGETAEGGKMYENNPPPLEPVRPPTDRRNAMQQYAGTERRSLSDITGPNPMRATQARILQGIIDDPTATARDKAIARQQLEDLQAHPFERAEGETDINRIKAAKTPRKSRAEAERSVEARKKGRKQRFGD